MIQVLQTGPPKCCAYKVFVLGMRITYSARSGAWSLEPLLQVFTCVHARATGQTKLAVMYSTSEWVRHALLSNLLEVLTSSQCM